MCLFYASSRLVPPGASLSVSLFSIRHASEVPILGARRAAVHTDARRRRARALGQFERRVIMIVGI